jgi:acetyltransferase
LGACVGTNELSIRDCRSAHGTRNLDALFRPQSIALFGADTVPLSRGSVLAKNLFAAGFHGPILPVHPTLGSIQGVYAFRTLAELPLIPDLAVIANPSDAVPELLAELGARGTRAAIVLGACRT